MMGNKLATTDRAHCDGSCLEAGAYLDRRGHTRASHSTALVRFLGPSQTQDCRERSSSFSDPWHGGLLGNPFSPASGGLVHPHALLHLLRRLLVFAVTVGEVGPIPRQVGESQQPLHDIYDPVSLSGAEDPWCLRNKIMQYHMILHSASANLGDRPRDRADPHPRVAAGWQLRHSVTNA